MSLQSLPPEIISHIADQLDSIHDLFNLLRVNKTLFHILIYDLCRKNIKSDGGSALVWYAGRRYEPGVSKMLDTGADINVRSPNEVQSTALLEAVLHKYTRIVRLLLARGALPDAADLRARRPLSVAASGRSDAAITHALLDFGARPNALAFEKRAPLTEAIRTNQASKVALLLQHGASVQVFRDRNTFLHVAAEKNVAPAIMEMLIDSGVPVDSPDGLGMTPLQVAAAHSCVRAVRLLLRYGADPNCRVAIDYARRPAALFFAAEKPRSRWKDNKAVIRTLISHGAQVNATNSEQKTPLSVAVAEGAIKQAQALLDMGANVMARDAGGNTVLHLAAASPSCRPDLLIGLVGKGADVNAVCGSRKETPLFSVIRNWGHIGMEWRAGVDCAQTLVSLGADVNAQNAEGLTPFSPAVRKGYVRLTVLLLQSGAVVDVRDAR